MKKHILSIILTLMAAIPVFYVQAQSDQTVVFREDFNDLNLWRPLNFSKIKKHTYYAITEDGDNHVLTAQSHASASGLIYKGVFDPNRTPILHWRWKVDSVYAGADPRTKAGDDYPLRIYVLFEYDPEKVGLATRTKYGLVKMIYGEYPPLAGINYVWASQPAGNASYISPYTDRAVMIPLRSGIELLGQWVEETVNVLEDYRKAFGEAPPKGASIAIMNDSDNTGEAAVSQIDFLEVRTGW